MVQGDCGLRGATGGFDSDAAADADEIDIFKEGKCSAFARALGALPILHE
jgi:hypothetical protein